ncbi:prolyl-tRNA synthetase [Candidatus Nomurabacteria bacterium]|nr:prolyl-tRNA synthetase [Candidatus Nomurabacteria bacterium]MCB9827741.1 prolyl-tRNA synthetase [Candidatus Nomurabacteria bacterium]
MKQSQLFTKTSKTISKGEVSLNAKLLLQAGFIDKEMAGAYSFLPLGLIVMEKITRIIQEEMNAIGGQKLSLTALQSPEVWQKTERWNDEVIDVWFKTKLKNGAELGLATTHEEPLTNLMKKFISSYKDLPAYVYQFQTKFRNETRAKSGILRTREFIMKDLYSFNRTQEELDAFYNKCTDAYRNIFKRTGIGDQTFFTFASGGSFCKFSHEFQTICEAGEDIIYIDRQKNIAINKEVYSDEVLKELEIDKNKLEKAKSIEVGNIFKLGTKYSKALHLSYLDQEGKSNSVVMGSYGTAPARIMGTIVELCNDDKGIIWPKEVAPFFIHLLNISNTDKASQLAKEYYEKLTSAGFDVLLDDRESVRPGEKFADSDLIGCPYRLVLSDKTISQEAIEVKRRDEDKIEIVKLKDLIKRMKQ